MKEYAIKKGHILQYKGDLNSKAYQVVSGLLRGYTIDEKGKEHIFTFAPEGWFIGDSVPEHLPADLFIEALEDSVVISFSKDLNKQTPNVNALVKRLEVLQKRVIMLMSATALERYDHFVETYPDLMQRVSQRHISSYLGITPEALSKAKGDRLRSKS